MKKKTLRKGFIFLICLVLVLILIPGFLPESLKSNLLGDLYQFPLPATVWGNFSDWSMVLVTGITAYYIYHTLKSQKEVTYQQLLMTRIALDQHRQSIMPRIVLNTPLTHKGNTDEEFYSGNYKGFTQLYNIGEIAKNVIIKITQGTQDNPNPKILIEKQIEEMKPQEFHDINYPFHQAHGNEDHRFFTIYWTFEDRLGNFYSSKMIKYHSFVPNAHRTISDINTPQLINLAL